MRYRDLFEKYSSDNSYLRNYLKTSEFDPYHYWGAITQWAERNAEGLEAFAEILGKDAIDENDIDEEDPGIFYKLPQHLQQQAAEWAIDYIMRNDPADAASTEFLSLQHNRLLPRQTWLVHFTDDPNAIAEQGFAMGTFDMTRLGLTTYTQNSAKERGYNFAFIADGRHANWAASEGKYGKHAVMFQNSGVHTWHSADEEDQIIFWGADVKPSDIVVLKHHRDDWYVQSHDQRHGYTDRSLFAGDFEKCVAWVITNFQQYHRALTK